MTESGSDDYLLDTSAVFALLKDELGADRVEELLRTKRVYLPFIVALEVFCITVQERGQDEARRRLAFLRRLPVVWLDHATDAMLVSAGTLKAAYRVSLADALIAAFAKETGATLVHKDPEYDALAAVITQERLPLKGAARS